MRGSFEDFARGHFIIDNKAIQRLGEIFGS
jgi:hypothetical protein